MMRRLQIPFVRIQLQKRDWEMRRQKGERGQAEPGLFPSCGSLKWTNPQRLEDMRASTLHWEGASAEGARNLPGPAAPWGGGGCWWSVGLKLLRDWKRIMSTEKEMRRHPRDRSKDKTRGPGSPFVQWNHSICISFIELCNKLPQLNDLKQYPQWNITVLKKEILPSGTTWCTWRTFSKWNKPGRIDQLPVNLK